MLISCCYPPEHLTLASKKVSLQLPIISISFLLLLGMWINFLKWILSIQVLHYRHIHFLNPLLFHFWIQIRTFHKVNNNISTRSNSSEWTWTLFTTILFHSHSILITKGCNLRICRYIQIAFNFCGDNYLTKWWVPLLRSNRLKVRRTTTSCSNTHTGP